MKLKDSELKNILAEVETEIASLLKTEGDALKKAKDDGSEEGPEASASESAPTEESAPAEGSAPEASAPAADASASPAPEASAPAPEMGAPEASASAGDPTAPAADPAADTVADPEALKAEYSKLDPETLKAHYMAAKAALFEVMGAAAGAGAPPEASASPAGMAPPTSPTPAPAAPEASNTEVPPPAFKAEIPASIKNVPATASLDNAGGSGGKGGLDDVKKSEAKVQDLEKQVELLAKALELSIGTPVRKAVTGTESLEAAAPSKELTKSDIKQKIRKAMESGKLTKSQREQLFSYTLGNTEFDQIKGLL
jgi:hypothetical protein